MTDQTNETEAQPDPAMHAALLMLEATLEKKGWDQPAELYAWTDTSPLPVVMISLIFRHPFDVLQEMFDGGFRPEPDWKALVLAFEGYRHLHFDEFMNLAGISLEDIPKASADVAMHAYHQRLSLMPGASQMPPAYRKEIRTVVAVQADGSELTLIRTRDEGEPAVLNHGAELGIGATGRLPAAMFNILNGRAPNVVTEEMKANQARADLRFGKGE